MSGKILVLYCLVITVLLITGSTQAQQPKNIPLIGYLGAGAASVLAARTEAFRQGLHELGYLEGKNILIEYRYAEGKYDRLPDLATELVRLKVDVIVTTGPTSHGPAKAATSTIPIVMAFDPDPVGSGFAASLARPGGNITGLSTLAPEMGGKQLELLKEIVPKLSRVAVIGNSTIPGDAQALRETVLAAGAYEIYLRYLDVRDPKDLAATFQAAAKGRADGLLVLGNPNLNAQRKQVVDLAVKHRLPATYTRPEYIEAGGLVYYGASYPDLFRRAAYYVDKILKGAKPADLPVEQPTKFELIINLKAAKQIGLTIPPKVLARADKVIK
ncbi:MAG TPA: ABC transporter substrate-binding protein [Methylomirabilota bacterium]|nr:ABC transporter substrate-binding protein [Methylomirabilota bacterium]